MTNFSLRHCALAVTLALAQSAAAQPPDAGRTLKEQQNPVPSLPDAKPSALELQPPASRASTPGNTRVTLRHFRITGHMVTADNARELLALLDDARGQSFDLPGMEALAARITRYYRERGYLFARAYLPAQDIKNATLEISVIEGRYFHVDVHNSSKVTGLTVSLWPGEAIEAQALERNLLLLSDIPGIVVKSTLKPGAAVGTSDLLIDISPGRSFIGSVDIDNYGNHYTGEFRGGVSLIFNNPTDAGDQLYLRANTTGSDMIFGTANYLRPVGNDGARVGAALAHVYYALASDFEFLDAHGTADIISAYAQYPYLRSRAFNINGQFGVTDKRLRDDIGLFDSTTRKTVDSAAFTLSGNSTDVLLGGGSNSFSAVATGGQVRFQGDDAKAVDKATAQSDGAYATLGVNALRSQYLTDRTSLYGSVSAQFASKNLVSSEKFSLGGPYGVRAYPQGEGTGDEGALINVELRHALSRTWQLAAFVDGGRITTNKDPWAPGENTRSLYGAGIGCNWNSAYGTLLRASAAWKLGSEMPTADDDRSPRLWVQLTQYF